MNRDEAQRLLSVYATGSLTEAERSALFAAALEDQELFDELAGEQALKEVLDEPGARQRLLAALEPAQHKAWWTRPWPWAAAAACLAVGVFVVISQGPVRPPPQEIAQVMKSAEPAPPVAVVPSAPEPARRKTLPVPAPPAVALQAPTEARKDAIAEVPPRQLADQSVGGAAVGAVQGFAAGGRGGVGAEALRARTEAAPVTLGFGFSYTVLVDGSLQITPAEPGYLTVIAGDRVIFPSNTIPEFMPITIAVPSGTSSLIIGFSRTPAVTGTPVHRDALTGRETDQDPPNGKILIQLSLTPATR